MSLLWFVHLLLLFYKIITLFAAVRRGRCLVIIRRIQFLNRYSRGRTNLIPTIEELVAELGAAFLCADLRITDDPRADHAQYLASLLAFLKADKKAIFPAASKASDAATFLAALHARNHK